MKPDFYSRFLNCVDHETHLKGKQWRLVDAAGFFNNKKSRKV